MRAWRILIVDDSPAMRSFIRRVIQLSGFGDAEFIEAANGEEGLNCIARHRPDFVLTDINMPVMDGEQFLQQLEAWRDCRPPVIVVSTDSTHTRVARMLSLGAASYLRKPFTPELMRQALEDLKLGSPGVYA